MNFINKIAKFFALTHLSDAEKIRCLVACSYVLSVGVIASSVSAVVNSYRLAELQRSVQPLLDLMNSK